MDGLEGLPEEVLLSLSVIGAGFGRTGTRSLKLALERLGFSPCYHMDEVFARPEHIPLWHEAARGRPPDWDRLLGPYRAAVDWPACSFWRELADEFPRSKVILTVRDTKDWYESARETIYPAIRRPMSDDPVIAEHQRMAKELILERTFGGRFEERGYAIGVYERHNEAVRASVPADRLLVYRAEEGWGSLCGFLGSEVPRETFPRANAREEFREGHERTDV
jgi:Sulfotransferase domain